MKAAEDPNTAFTDPAQKQVLLALPRYLRSNLRRLSAKTGLDAVALGPVVQWLEDHGLAREHSTGPDRSVSRSIGYSASQSIPFDIDRYPYRLEAKTADGWVPVMANDKVAREDFTPQEVNARIDELQDSRTATARTWITTNVELGPFPIPVERPITAIRTLRRSEGAPPVPAWEMQLHAQWKRVPAAAEAAL